MAKKKSADVLDNSIVLVLLWLVGLLLVNLVREVSFGLNLLFGSLLAALLFNRYVIEKAIDILEPRLIFNKIWPIIIVLAFFLKIATVTAVFVVLYPREFGTIDFVIGMIIITIILTAGSIILRRLSFTRKWWG